MKEIKKISPLKREFNAVKIFLDELFLIENILKENAQNFKIETDTHEFDSVEELKNNYAGKELTKLNISTTCPSINIDLESKFPCGYARLYCSSDNITDIGMFEKLTTVLLKCERKFSFVDSFLIWFIVYSTMIYTFKNPSAKILLTEMPSKLLIGLKIFFSLCSIVVLATSLIGLYRHWIKTFKYSEIIIMEKKDYPNFLKRNHIEIGLILGVAGLIVTIFQLFIKQ